MKLNRLLAVLLTALFLAPFCAVRAEDAPAFTIDETVIVRGMNRSWQQGYTPSISKGKWNLILPVRSEKAAGTITAELLLRNERKSPFKPQTMKVEARGKEKGFWEVQFQLDLYSDRKNADYPCVIRLTGKDGEGKDLTQEIPYVIRLRGAKEVVEKARIEVPEVAADLSVGEEGEIRVTLANPCEATVIEDLELKISDAAGHILPRSAETMKIGAIPIGESVTVSYPVTVLEKASVAPHMLKLDLAWTALDTAASLSVNHTVAVSQEICLEQGGLKMAPNVAAGDSVTLTLPLMNMGKADVVNVLATVSMPGVTERQSVLVGNIQPGETRQAQLVLSPAKDVTGDFSGTLAVECTDQDGNPAAFTIPLNLRVDKPRKAETEQGAAGGSAKPETASPLTIGLGGGCCLLLLLLMAQSIVLRRKLHLLEEERL